MAKEDRGFASMDRAKQREIASKGGKAAHQKGTAHEWTSEEARDAGRKGGIASHQRRREQAANVPGDRDTSMTGSSDDSMIGRGNDNVTGIESGRNRGSNDMPMTEREEQ
ncbi:MAG TPA: KGG domain-containing protein [Vicinamibacterales bacterium]|nr:KGG domain-containing protein [Vicinamibacterales bacterium]